MSDFNIQAKGLFGRYCRIEMFRYGVPNEFYIHKIVSQSRQNTYCDVPLRWDSKPEKHEAKEGVPFPDYLEEVIWVVQCGIDETKVFPVALKDVELLGEDFNEGCEFQKVGSDGYPFCASATEIMRLRDENTKLRGERNHWKVEQTHAYSNWEDAHKRVVDIEAENAKLRELVRDMWPFVKAGWVHTCPNRECCLFEECDADSERECPIEEHMAARMRELGIEVPNGN